MRQVSARKVLAVLCLLLLPVSAGLFAETGERVPAGDEIRLDSLDVAGLRASVRVIRDGNDVPHIFALNDHDALFMLGWVHAHDRFFQMDTLRRTFSGTLAELVGAAAVPSDVQFRTLGLRRAAEATAAVLSGETREWLDGYVDGVNAYLARGENLLPLEYTALSLTKASVPAWTDVDSIVVAKGLAFGLSFDLSDLELTESALTFAGAGAALGFDGAALFSEDLFRAASFDPTVSIPGFLDAVTSPAPSEKTRTFARSGVPSYLDDKALALVRSARESLGGVEAIRTVLEGRDSPLGSNWWVASGSLTESGLPLLANDPHLGIDAPAIFYEVQMRISGQAGARPTTVFGVSFAGTPGVILGCNRWICWGATTNRMDVTDVYLEQVQLDPVFGPVATVFEGHPEPLVAIPQSYLVNAVNPAQADVLVDSGIGVTDPGGLTLVVPRRNNGPILNLAIDPADPTTASAISVQYTGWGATRELEAIRGWARARSVGEFAAALQSFDVGSQNWSVIDMNGNIAYFTSAELPIREDLQNLNAPDGGVPPFLLRDGTHTFQHEWLGVQNPQPNQSIPFEILPFSEMPQVINPAQGYVLNCNNDPVGTTADNNALNQLRPGGGLYYLNAGYAPGLRMGQIQNLFDEALAGPGAGFTPGDFKAFQANNQLLGAEVLVPYVLEAFDNATSDTAPAALAALGIDLDIAEAIGFLGAWDYSTPTGLAEGYDPGDDPSALPEPSESEIADSVAATIYSTWRGQVIQAVIDGTLERLDAVLAAAGATPVLADQSPGTNLSMSALRNLFDNFETQQGRGASGINFFEVAGVDDAATARDVIVLQALRDALDLLASDAFAAAFGGSSDLFDYRWGYLHRVEFDHLLGGPFNIPGAGGLASVSPELRGVARPGGLGALDASSHGSRADGVNEFMFGSGPARRFIGEMPPSGPRAEEVIPGGTSGVLGSPFQSDQLRLWLTNQYKEFYWQPGDVLRNIRTYQQFFPME